MEKRGRKERSEGRERASGKKTGKREREEKEIYSEEIREGERRRMRGPQQAHGGL